LLAFPLEKKIDGFSKQNGNDHSEKFPWRQITISRGIDQIFHF
jgi:hypothetical protein